MSRNRYSYTVEKLSMAVECLATHPGDARQRLNSAFLIFHTLTENDFPPEYQSKWAWVKKELTRYGPIRDHKGEIFKGSVANTMSRIRNNTASKIAKAIYGLYWSVSEHKEPF